MASLHIVNKSPFEHSALDSCLRLAKSGASILLIEDATYALRAGSAAAQTLSKALDRFKVFALTPDMDARGLPQSASIDGVSFVDYAGFVELTTQHDKVNSWL